ncbi:MAG: NAD(P)(+) transhydrogenase (Re/Si-specific) subunit beta [Chlorobi bacterium]|nr:NAD(P)(+) transhydrogenase (Re/Si-specific) subunit beta [Chlorobiota bacterium]
MSWRRIFGASFLLPLGAMQSEHILAIVYVVASVTFIVGLKQLSHPRTARRGNLVAAVGMALAIVATMALHTSNGKPLGNILLIVLAMAIGTAIGWVAARRVPMTAMPQMVSLFNGMGGGCAAAIAMLEMVHATESASVLAPTASSMIVASAIIGSVSLSGSLVAFAKLQGIVERSLRFRGQNVANTLVLLIALGIGTAIVVMQRNDPLLFATMIATALLYGIAFVVPIGGADMPVVISFLNSCTGVAAAFGGLYYGNHVMLTGGIVVGAAGMLLTLLMARAMNRSVLNVLFSHFGETAAPSGTTAHRTMRSITPDDAAVLLRYARDVVIVPGYGLAVAQGQHALVKLASELERNGVRVRYAIHPVAGRMPGHMNVLLAEANVPYEQLVEMDDINPDMPNVDVVLVVGANDVVNPAARTDPSSPLWGMPIIDADRARNVIVIKRSMNPGYAGVDNELFYMPNTSMLFGDAKAMMEAVLERVKQL